MGIVKDWGLLFHVLPTAYNNWPVGSFAQRERFSEALGVRRQLATRLSFVRSKNQMGWVLFGVQED